MNTIEGVVTYFTVNNELGLFLILYLQVGSVTKGALDIADRIASCLHHGLSPGKF